MKKQFGNVEGLLNTLMKIIEGYWAGFLIALPKIAFALIVFGIIVFIANKFVKLFNQRLSARAADPLFTRFVTKLIKYSLIVSGAILGLHIMGLTGIAGGLLASAGVSAIIFGFAFRDIAENFLAGIILAFDRPFSLNDTIRVGDYSGHVAALNFRTTHIKTFDEKDVYIPNSKMIKEILTNLTRDGLIRLDFVVGIALEDDISAATSLIERTAKAAKGVLQDRLPFTVVEELSANSVNIRVFFWTTTDDYKRGVLIMKSDVIKDVKEKLIQHGFTLPSNIQELKIYDKAESIPITVFNNDQPPAL